MVASQRPLSDVYNELVEVGTPKNNAEKICDWLFDYINKTIIKKNQVSDAPSITESTPITITVGNDGNSSSKRVREPILSSNLKSKKSKTSNNPNNNSSSSLFSSISSDQRYSKNNSNSNPRHFSSQNTSLGNNNYRNTSSTTSNGILPGGLEGLYEAAVGNGFNGTFEEFQRNLASAVSGSSTSNNNDNNDIDENDETTQTGERSSHFPPHQFPYPPRGRGTFRGRGAISNIADVKEKMKQMRWTKVENGSKEERLSMALPTSREGPSTSAPRGRGAPFPYRGRRFNPNFARGRGSFRGGRGRGNPNENFYGARSDNISADFSITNPPSGEDPSHSASDSAGNDNLVSSISNSLPKTP